MSYFSKITMMIFVQSNAYFIYFYGQFLRL